MDKVDLSSFPIQGEAYKASETDFISETIRPVSSTKNFDGKYRTLKKREMGFWGSSCKTTWFNLLIAFAGFFRNQAPAIILQIPMTLEMLPQPGPSRRNICFLLPDN